jgi:hypothetical protein
LVLRWCDWGSAKVANYNFKISNVDKNRIRTATLS